MNDLNGLGDLAAAMVITGITIFLALAVYFVFEVITMITSKRGKPRRIDLLAVWPSTILPYQSWIGRQIEEAIPPLHIAQAEQIAARRWEILEMSPASEESDDD